MPYSYVAEVTLELVTYYRSKEGGNADEDGLQKRTVVD